MQTSEHKSSWGGVLAAVGALAGWSAVPLFIKHFSATIDFWTSNGWRYGFAALIWLPVAVLGTRRGTIPPAAWRAALVPAAFNAGGQTLFTYAFYLLDPALVTFALRFQIIFVTLGAALLFAGERRVIRAPAYLIGLGLVFGGTMLTVALDRNFGARATTLGVLIAVCSGMLFAGYGLAVRKCMRNVKPLPAFAIISQYTAAVMVVQMLLFGRHGGIEAVTLLTPSAFVWLLVSSILGIALGHVFYYIAMERLGVAPTAGVIQLQPFCVGVAESALPMFGASLTSAQWFTGSIAVAGAAVILRVQHIVARRARSSAPAPDPAAQPIPASAPAPLASTHDDERSTTL